MTHELGCSEDVEPKLPLLMVMHQAVGTEVCDGISTQSIDRYVDTGWYQREILEIDI